MITIGHCEATSDGAPLMILELMQYGDLKWFLAENRYKINVTDNNDSAIAILCFHRPHEGKLSVITVSITLSIIFDVSRTFNHVF